MTSDTPPVGKEDVLLSRTLSVSLRSGLCRTAGRSCPGSSTDCPGDSLGSRWQRVPPPQ